MGARGERGEFELLICWRRGEACQLLSSKYRKTKRQTVPSLLENAALFQDYEIGSFRWIDTFCLLLILACLYSHGWEERSFHKGGEGGSKYPRASYQRPGLVFHLKYGADLRVRNYHISKWWMPETPKFFFPGYFLFQQLFLLLQSKRNALLIFGDRVYVSWWIAE